jgi:hypothetical protein
MKAEKEGNGTLKKNGIIELWNITTRELNIVRYYEIRRQPGILPKIIAVIHSLCLQVAATWTSRPYLIHAK